jgi:cytochrome P450
VTPNSGCPDSHPSATQPLANTEAEFTVIVIPTKFLEELRKLPDDVVSFSGAVEQTMHAKYTEILVEAPLIIHTVKSNLTPSLVRLNPSIYEEVIHAIREVMPPCDGWTSVNINRSLLRIVALVSGRVFIGTELSRSPEYLDAAINYTVELMEARRALERTRAWMRPFVGHRLPEVKKLKERVAQAIRFLQPVVEARLKLSEEEKPNDMLRWIMDNQAKVKHYSTEELARLQLGLSFAAIHTTTLTATNVYVQLLASVIPT